MALLEADAYLLRAISFGDTSRIAVLFSRETGKLRVISKGYRNPKNPCAGALEPFRQVHVIYYYRPLAYGGLQHRANLEPLYRLRKNPLKVTVQAAKKAAKKAGPKRKATPRRKAAAVR